MDNCDKRYKLKVAEILKNANAPFVFAKKLASGQVGLLAFKKVVQLLKEEAARGNARAQAVLGYWYFGGIGVRKNSSIACAYFRQSAEQGDNSGVFGLAMCFEDGKGGVRRSYKEAFKLYRKAAEGGDGPAQREVGRYYYYGNGVPKNYKKAVKWFRKAARQGAQEAYGRLGICYEKGKGVAQDFRKAVVWYKKAAKQRDQVAQSRLAYCYDHGLGVRKRHDLAEYWYKKSEETIED